MFPRFFRVLAPRRARIPSTKYFVVTRRSLPCGPPHVLVGIRKKNHIWMPPARVENRGDHAGSLIVSMAIDLATKSLLEFKYTHKR